MSVVVRRYRRGGWHVDIRLMLPDGQPYRQRKRINSHGQRRGDGERRASDISSSTGYRDPR